MFGNSKNDPVAKLQKDLAAAQSRRAGHADRLKAAQDQLPQAEAKVRRQIDADPAALKAARLARQEVRDWHQSCGSCTLNLLLGSYYCRIRITYNDTILAHLLAAVTVKGFQTLYQRWRTLRIACEFDHYAALCPEPVT
jgi:hypothetical protein